MSLDVSVLIIAQNVERTLKRCLDSLTEFKEVILVDGGSEDRTEEIAKSYPNVVYYLNPWPGFIEQRCFSLSKATHKWCFMIDADEMATPECVQAIAETIELENPKAMYRIMRTEYFEGQAIEVGFGKSGYQERLFLRDKVEYVGGVHHEHLICGIRSCSNHPHIGDLPSPIRILHDEEYGLVDIIRKMPRFSYLIAGEKFNSGKRVSLLKVLFTFPLVFLKTYRKSWRAGRVGLMMSLNEAYHRGLVALFMYNTEHFKGAKLPEDWKGRYLG
jgi:glycosyltransferase involved in cell wall biosynthesis